MDIWSGNRSIENEARAPGLEIFVYSQPFGGESRSGDVHYVSVCAGGVLTRLILADVSGHWEAVAETSRNLRTQMRRFINSKRQQSLVHSLNREFTRLEESPCLYCFVKEWRFNGVIDSCRPIKRDRRISAVPQFRF